MLSQRVRKYLYIGFISIVAATVLLSVYYLITVHYINQVYNERYNAQGDVALRKFPYPYRAAIAISNDIDATGTLEEFLEINKYLNTTEQTSMGTGPGLNIGGSFYFYGPDSGTISYLSNHLEIQEAIRDQIRKGYVDFLHSYGQKSNFDRNDAIRAIKDLEKNNLKLDVWIDHDHVINNLGDDVNSGLGAHPSSNAYHADLTLHYGIKFACLGRLTMIVGQATQITPEAFTSIYDPDHPLHSVRNIIKEFAKNVLANFGYPKYSMHKENDLVKVTELADGQKVFEFMRFIDYWKGIPTGADSRGLSYSLSKRNLERLKENHGYMIAYTHLGKNADCAQYICEETQNTLRNLANEYRAGNIFVFSTSKLLNYFIAHKYLKWSYEIKNDKTTISILNIDNPISGSFVPNVRDLKGITFYVANTKDAHVMIGGQEIKNIMINDTDYTGKKSITIQ